MSVPYSMLQVGNTVAHFAAIGGYVHIIKYLKGKGVNLNSPNDVSYSVLGYLSFGVCF